MSEQVKATAPAVVTAPTQKAIAETRALIKDATLSTLAAVAQAVHSTVSRLQGTATDIQGSLTTKTIAVVSKQTLSAVAVPVRDTLAAVGGRVPNLSTVRMGLVKMAIRYGMEHTLPYWKSVKEVKDSGDAALSAAIGAVVVDGVVNPDARLTLETAAKNALAAFGVADNAQAKFLRELGVAVDVAAETPEDGEGEDGDKAGAGADGDAQMIADEAAQLRAELALMREIAEAARVALGVPDDATDAEALMLIQRLEAVAPMSMDEMAAAIAD